MVNIGERRVWHNGHDGYRADIHVQNEGRVVDGYEGWAIIENERHAVFYIANGNSWETAEQRKRGQQGW
jgi:hypothetical protein